MAQDYYWKDNGYVRVDPGNIVLKKEVDNTLNDMSNDINNTLDNITDNLNETITNKLDPLTKIVYTNHLSAYINLTPAIGYKDEDTTVTIRYGGQINGAELEYTYTVKQDGNIVNINNGSTITLNTDTSFHIDVTVAGITKSADAGFKTYYPVFTYSGDTDELPDNKVKQPVMSSPANLTVTYNDVQAASYLYIAVPDTMKVNSGSSNGYDSKFMEYKRVDYNNVGYIIYRTANKVDAGNYTINFK